MRTVFRFVPGINKLPKTLLKMCTTADSASRIRPWGWTVNKPKGAWTLDSSLLCSQRSTLAKSSDAYEYQMSVGNNDRLERQVLGHWWSHWDWERWWASRLCTLRIRGFCLLINVTVPSTYSQQTNDCTLTDTTFILRQPLLTRFVIHPILPHIIIAVLHHGKAPSIDNHPNTELTHHSEAPSWRTHWSLN